MQDVDVEPSIHADGLDVYSIIANLLKFRNLFTDVYENLKKLTANLIVFLYFVIPNFDADLDFILFHLKKIMAVNTPLSLL